MLTKGELAESNPIDPLRDPRLRDRRSEQETTTQPVKERFLVENPELLPVPVDHSHHKGFLTMAIIFVIKKYE